MDVGLFVLVFLLFFGLEDGHIPTFLASAVLAPNNSEWAPNTSLNPSMQGAFISGPQEICWKIVFLDCYHAVGLLGCLGSLI